MVLWRLAVMCKVDGLVVTMCGWTGGHVELELGLRWTGGHVELGLMVLWRLAVMYRVDRLVVTMCGWTGGHVELVLRWTCGDVELGLRWTGGHVELGLMALWRLAVLWLVCVPLIPVFCVVYLFAPNTKVRERYSSSRQRHCETL